MVQFSRICARQARSAQVEQVQGLYVYREERGLILDTLSAAETNAAIARSAEQRRTEPRALSARYDPASGRVVVELTNGCSFAFPARAVQGLEEASDAQLADVETLGDGYGLHWEALDVDISVPGVLAGLFGTRAYMARRAGEAKSPAKAAAARANGARGGRPRRAVTA